MKPMDLNSGITITNTGKTKLAMLIGVICLGASTTLSAEQVDNSNTKKGQETLTTLETIVVLGEKLGGTLAENTSSVTVLLMKQTMAKIKHTTIYSIASRMY